MDKDQQRLYILFKESAQLFTAISLGVFLFILFFQPFLPSALDFNNQLIFIAGFGAIIFLILSAVSITAYLLRHKFYFSEFVSGFTMLALSSAGFAFYLRYVGKEPITFYIMFKIALICLSAPVALRISNIIKELKQQRDFAIIEKRDFQNQLEKFETENLHKTIDFVSENASDSLSLMVSEVALIKSADNYVEIVYQESGNFKKKLLRNTLKNVENQLKSFPNFVRCHRICIVNAHFIEKIHKDDGNHWISVKGYDENIPVSRQYLLKLRDIS